MIVQIHCFTDTEIGTETGTDRQIQISILRQTNRQANRQTNRQTPPSSPSHTRHTSRPNLSLPTLSFCPLPRPKMTSPRSSPFKPHETMTVFVCWLVGCLTSQQQASISQGRIYSDNFTCCHTEIEAADQTFYLTQSQYTDTEPTSPSADPITPGAWQGSHWSAIFKSLV